MTVATLQSKLSQRAQLAKSPMAKKVFSIMEDKKANLALSCDLTRSEEILKLARELGPYISILKTHVDIIEDFHPSFVDELKSIAKQEAFLVFEDRKFADIGNTVYHQYTKGLYQISSWADMVNAHAHPGHGVLQGIRKGNGDEQKGVLLIAQMSSQGSFRNPEYISFVESLAEDNDDLVFGFIAQEKLFLDPKWIWMTPGIKLSGGEDKLGQSYHHPKEAICEKGTDIIIVGRDIIHNEHPEKRAKEYQKVAWDALMERSF